MSGPDLLVALRAFVEAHAQPHPQTGSREPIDYFMHMSGATLQHHALAQPPPDVDEALLQEMNYQGLLDIDYREHLWRLTPTPAGARVVAEHDRVQATEPVADTTALAIAVSAQAEAVNKLAWPAVRPVLVELRAYWEAGGLSKHGIQVPALLNTIPEEDQWLFGATLRALVEGEYLRPTTDLSALDLPAELELTRRSHAVIDGWPGAAPDELFENLLAVLVKAAASEEDPQRRGRLERLAETFREVGVSTAGEVLAKVMMGG